MKKVLCRVFQGCMKAGNYLMGYRMPEKLTGAGSVKNLPELFKHEKIDHVLVVSGPNITRSGLSRPMLEALQDAGMRYTLFCNLSSNPTSENVEEGYRLYCEQQCQAIIAFGGGSPMDCAKAIAARVVCPHKTVAQLQGLLKVRRKIPLFVAVPTTAGSGSETTVAAVITNSATHHKASINDPAIIPRYAVLDPELAIGLPPAITAATGMDALCHAVEAYTNHTYNTRLENDLARQAVKLIHDNLLDAYHDGSCLEARQNMQLAAFYAGRAFTRGCVGYVHAIGHTLGGLYGVAHGKAMGILLPHVMRQYGSAVYPRLAELADECGIQGADKKEKALAFIQWIEEMKEKLGLPDGVDMIQDKDVDQIISWAMKEANPLYPVPVVWLRKDFLRLLATVRTK